MMLEKTSPSRSLPPTILIADDEQAVCEMLEAFLAMEGFRLRRARSGTEALEAVAAAPPDLILMDLKMPGIGGYEAIRKLQAEGQGGIPVLVMSGHYGDASTTGLIQREPNVKGFFAKPFALKDIRRAVNTALSTEPA